MIQQQFWILSELIESNVLRENSFVRLYSLFARCTHILNKMHTIWHINLMKRAYKDKVQHDWRWMNDIEKDFLCEI